MDGTTVSLRGDQLEISNTTTRKEISDSGQDNNTKSIESSVNIMDYGKTVYEPEKTVLQRQIYQQWLACEILNITMSVILSYIVLSLIIYHKKKGLRNFVHKTKSKVRSKRFESALDCLTVAAALFAIVRIITDIDLIVGRDSIMNCSYLKKPKIFISFVSFGCICINYWLRQRIIHGNKQLSHLSSRSAKIFGIVFLALMSILYISDLILFMIKDRKSYRPIEGFGCSDGKGMAPFYILGFASVTTQITLVALLIYPILKRGKKLSTKINMKREHRLIKMVFRAFITAAVGVTFTIAGLIFLALVDMYVDDLGMLVINVNLFVLVFCSIMSFADWKSRLFPFGKVSSFDRDTSLSVRSLQMAV